MFVSTGFLAIQTHIKFPEDYLSYDILLQQGRFFLGWFFAIAKLPLNTSKTPALNH